MMMVTTTVGKNMGKHHNNEALKAQIKSAFDLFDKDKKGRVVQEEISTIMRYLGTYPTEKDIIRKILPEMQENEPTASFVTYEKFEKKMLEVLLTHEYDADSEETILEAFRVLDPEKKGFVDAEDIKELLSTKGTPFRDKEMEAFLSVAKDRDTGRIYYEDYVALLVQELDKK